MMASPFDQLPEELQLQVFTYLDSPPPSALKNRHEPHLSLTSASDEHHHLKHISCVSRRWRRIVLPLLFRHARVRLDALPRPKWENCVGCLRYASVHWATSCDATTPLSDIAAYHDQQFEVGVVTNDQWNANERLGTWSGLTWESRFFHRSQEFLHFVRTHDLPVETFVLYTDKLLKNPGRFPHRAPAAADRFKASAVLWQRLLSVIDPRRIVVMAPPAELAYLTNTAVDLFGEWAFSDMDLHILELATDDLDSSSPFNDDPHRRRSSSPSLCRALPPRKFSLSEVRYTPETDGSIADASIIHLRPWTHLSLNEGSFLKAYGTYEYFERGPPSIIYSIKNCLSSSLIASQTHHPQTLSSPTSPPPAQTPCLSTLRKFTYTAILPFAHHLDFRPLLPQLSELDVQLAPHPTSNILNDKDRVGKAELEDCWQEFFSGYRLLTRFFSTTTLLAAAAATSSNNTHANIAVNAAVTTTSTPSRPHFPTPTRLKKFICRDKANAVSKELREDIDEEFIPLCLPLWAEMEEGVFVRVEAPRQ